jgi:hypothetical protein
VTLSLLPFKNGQEKAGYLAQAVQYQTTKHEAEFRPQYHQKNKINKTPGKSIITISGLAFNLTHHVWPNGKNGAGKGTQP